jgi:hypothetical protein
MTAAPADGRGKGGAHGCSSAALIVPLRLQHTLCGGITRAARLALTATAAPQALRTWLRLMGPCPAPVLA